MFYTHITPINRNELAILLRTQIKQKEITIINLANVCPYSESSIKRWLKAFKVGEIKVLEPRSTRPKTQPNETPIRIKERVIDLRKETGLCAKKLHWRLEKARIKYSYKYGGKYTERRRTG